jgi:hypothetical protein
MGWSRPKAGAALDDQPSYRTKCIAPRHEPVGVCLIGVIKERCFGCRPYNKRLHDCHGLRHSRSQIEAEMIHPARGSDHWQRCKRVVTLCEAGYSW